MLGDPLPAFPEPVADLKCGPIWLRSQIDAYRREAAWARVDSGYERCYGRPLPLLGL